MAGSINWNNYSSAQILQMQKCGVQVPADVLAKASATSASNTKIDDEAIRENIDIEMEEFMNSEEFTGAKRYEQLQKLGSAQETKYKAANQAAQAADEIKETMETLNAAIAEQSSAIEDAVQDAGDDQKAVNKAYQNGVKNLENIASGSSTRAEEVKELYEKAVTAEVYADKAAENAHDYIDNRRNVWAVFTLGISELFTHGRRENANHIIERSSHITEATSDMQLKAETTLSTMQDTANYADAKIREVSDNIVEEPKDDKDDNKKTNRFLN